MDREGLAGRTGSSVFLCDLTQGCLTARCLWDGVRNSGIMDCVCGQDLCSSLKPYGIYK